jgi:hypothetical protein
VLLVPWVTIVPDFPILQEQVIFRLMARVQLMAEFVRITSNIQR